MGTPKQMGFHEATVVRFCRYDTGLELELEDVLVDGEKSRVALLVSPVFSVVIDGEVSNALLMEADDGEVLELEMSDHGFFLIVVWVDYSRTGNDKYFTKSYRVSGGKVTLSVI